MTPATLAILAWGGLAFGAVYPWAFTPLLVACAMVGVAALSIDRSRSEIPWSLVAALSVIAAAVAVQLIPLRPGLLRWLSPATDQLLRQYLVVYATATEVRHPLSIEPSSTWRGLAFLVCFGVLLIGLARVLTAKEVHRLVGGIVVLGTVIALVGLIQRATSATTIYGFWKPLMESRNIFAPFVNHNHFAGWMLMAIPLALGLLGELVRDAEKTRSEWRRRVLWFAARDGSQAVLVGSAILVMGLSLVLTMSRSGMSGFVVTLLLMAWFVMRTHDRSKRLVTAGYLLFVISVPFLWTGVDVIVRRFARADTGSLGGRLVIWADAARIIRDFPLTGTGLNTFGTATLFYQAPIHDGHLREAHNDYLQLAAEGGLLVGVPIVLTTGVFIGLVYRRLRDATDEQGCWVRAGAVSGLLGVALQDTVEFSLQMPGNAALFAVLAAVAIHAPEQSRTHRRSRHAYPVRNLV